MIPQVSFDADASRNARPPAGVGQGWLLTSVLAAVVSALGECLVWWTRLHFDAHYETNQHEYD
jgi:hypothetical protein